MELKFTKMQGCGNDYIYVNCFEQTVEDPAALAIRLSDRHFGIGADGIILIRPSKIADARMELYDADGSFALMCGNGIRCVAKYVYERGIAVKDVLHIDTPSGVKAVYPLLKDGKVEKLRVNMGKPGLLPQDIPTTLQNLVEEPLYVLDRTFLSTCVSMGNPHSVQFVDQTADFPVERYGKELEFHPVFPQRANIEFVQVLSRNEINMRVWERGSGETWACGTGSCASVVACVLTGRTDRHVTVHLLGGDLDIYWNEETGEVEMTGPAEFVFDGTVLV